MKKKIVIALLTCSLAVFFTSCGNSGEKKENKPQQTSVSDSKETKNADDKASANEETSNEENDDNLSQAEWIKKHVDQEGTELGYTIVDNIDMTYEDKTISYDHIEKYTKDSGEEVLLVYFNFTNSSSEDCAPCTFFNFFALQNDESVPLYSYNINNDEIDHYIDNLVDIVPSGETVKVVQILELADWNNPIKLRVDDANVYNQDMSKQQLQQQEVEITDM